tara:strand:+ start:980 stop:2173 length:1194 start_codon:yes stop_codon:yes gene_type:complete
MKKLLLLLLLVSLSFSANAQLAKELYKEFLKYGTFYTAGDINNSYETPTKSYFVRTNPNGGLYSIPDVVDGTEYNPFDYRIGFGIRKLARFDYEVKGTNFYNGTENNVALDAPTAAVAGFEYLFHYEEQRQRGDCFKNYRYFLRHTGKNHILKAESRSEGNIGFQYNSAESRFRLPIGKKFSISAGSILRTHQQAFGYNPIEIWLNETDANGNPANPWYFLGRQNGYEDVFYESTWTDPTTGDSTTAQDWFWTNPAGDRVADSDLEFRETIFPRLMNEYNDEIYSQLPLFMEIAPIVGFDFYHYQNDFWLHFYANSILPFHTYVMGETDFTYGNRNNWGKGGLIDDHKFEQWTDYQVGLMFGTKIGKNLGLYIEGEYTQMWGREIFNSSFGLNYTFN